MYFSPRLVVKNVLALFVIFVVSLSFFVYSGVSAYAASPPYPLQIKNTSRQVSNNSYSVFQGQALVININYPSCDASCGNEMWYANNIPPQTTSTYSPPVTTGSNITTWTLQTMQNTPVGTYTVTVGATSDAGANLGSIDLTINIVSNHIPGGTWISPGNNFEVQGTTLHFAAHAYPTNQGDPPIAKVNFTVTWPGSNWSIACTAYPPSQGNMFTCDWTITGVPNGASGPLTVSFDVYDTAGNVNFAPNGLHQESTNWTAPLRNWQLTGYQPGQGDHRGRDYWAVDLISNNTAVYPLRPGKVVYAQWNCQTVSGKPPCYGYVVVIDHGNGLYSIYAHLAATGLPKIGQQVSINTQIGTMSDSGCPVNLCGGPHLHFAARIGPPNLGANALFGSNTPVRTPF